MYRQSLKIAIFLPVVCLWTADSTDLFACGLFGTPSACSTVFEEGYDQDDQDAKGLPINLASFPLEFVALNGSLDRYIVASELHRVSRWHLRGPPNS